MGPRPADDPLETRRLLRVAARMMQLLADDLEADPASRGSDLGLGALALRPDALPDLVRAVDEGTITTLHSDTGAKAYEALTSVLEMHVVAPGECYRCTLREAA